MCISLAILRRLRPLCVNVLWNTYQSTMCDVLTNVDSGRCVCSSRMQQIAKDFITVEMLFHAKALEIYSQCFQQMDGLQEYDDLEVGNWILISIILHSFVLFTYTSRLQHLTLVLNSQMDFPSIKVLILISLGRGLTSCRRGRVVEKKRPFNAVSLQNTATQLI